MPDFKTINDLLKQDLKNKKVLVRADLNVPMKQSGVADATRIRSVIPTILKLHKAGATVLIISHFGRPEGKFDSSSSLSPIVDALSEELSLEAGKKVEVKFAVDCRGLTAQHAVEALSQGDILLLENLRFHAEEEKNDSNFARELASLADYYVNDAFSCSHRSHASITGITEFLPAYAGISLEREILSVTKTLEKPERPMAAIVGGSKISTKIAMLNSLSEKADYLFIGGGMANTFLYAKGYDIGKSLCEKNLKAKALEIIANAEKRGCKIILPEDATCAKEFAAGVETKIRNLDTIQKDEMILDAGSKTIIKWYDILSKCKSVIWNGPLGAFETQPFDNTSVAIARIVANLTLEKDVISVAGGGDTVSLLATAGVRESFSYVSTAGGAFLEWLEGKGLPGIDALVKSSAKREAA